MKKEIFKGVATALVTPFSNGAVDYNSLKNLIQKQIDANIDAIVILGTTGEPATILQKERERIIKECIQYARGQTKIIVGCGSNSTKVAINYYKQAQSYGADGALIVTPYYNKCTKQGLFEHYLAISNEGSLPIIAYNVPSRTGVNILPQTALELCKIKNVVGIKEASGNIMQILDLLNLLKGKMSIYSGDDALNTIFYSFGAKGCISVASNIMPKTFKQIFNMCDSGKIKEANKIQEQNLALINSLFLEVNPIPIKCAMNYLGLCKNEVRAPLTKMEKNNREKLIGNLNSVKGKMYDCL